MNLFDIRLAGQVENNEDRTKCTVWHWQCLSRVHGTRIIITSHRASWLGYSCLCIVMMAIPYSLDKKKTSAIWPYFGECGGGTVGLILTAHCYCYAVLCACIIPTIVPCAAATIAVLPILCHTVIGVRYCVSRRSCVLNNAASYLSNGGAVLLGCFYEWLLLSSRMIRYHSRWNFVGMSLLWYWKISWKVLTIDGRAI